MAKIVSPETGNYFGSDDVVGGSKALFTLSVLLLFSEVHHRFQDFWLKCCRKFATMSNRDDMLSSVTSSSQEESYDSDTSAEMEVVGRVQPYVDEPLAHSSDEEEDLEVDQDGLSPAVLRSRCEGEITVDEW